MLKILYAAGNTSNSLIQLSRFIQATFDKPYVIKIAAYKQSSPAINIDWTLDCLLDMFNPQLIQLDNDNYKIYFDQIKYFSPDLIISDMEYFTSYAGNLLNIPVWQCSSSLINFAFTKKQKYNMGIFKQYSYLFNRRFQDNQRLINILDNSDRKFIYSHFGDTEFPPEIEKGYEWIRPYHNNNKISPTCQHQIVIGLLKLNKKIIASVKNYDDVIIFSSFKEEKYPNIILKNIDNSSEYYCNLKNSDIFICEGQTSFLADAFYNQKKCIVMPDHQDLESLINSTISQKLKLSNNVYSINEDFLNQTFIDFQPQIKDHIKFLDEKIQEL